MSGGGILLTNLAAVAGLMVVLWLLSLRLRDASIIDIAWGPACVMVVWLSVSLGPHGSGSRALLLAVLTTVWGARLGGYLAWRARGQGEDRRYAAMRARHGSRFGLVSLWLVFGLQGIGAWTITLPVQSAVIRPDLGGLAWLAAAGVVVWAGGLFFEAVGDLQLARFKADPANAGLVMDRGLWRYTRHPNYFGDACVWWGLYLVALSAGARWWTAVGPVLMTVLLLRFSGVALLERTIADRRPGYREYVERTSAFLPRPPKE